MSNQLFPLNRNAFYERSMVYLPPNNNVVVLGKIKGSFSASELEEAVKKLQQKHPLMNAHVEIREDGSSWFVAKALATIPIKKIARTSEDSWKDIISDEYNNPFNIMETPLIRILWLYQEDVSDIILFCHHIICDGRSLTGVLHDLVNFLGNKVPVDTIEQVPSIDQTFPLEQVKLSRITRLISSKLCKSWLRAGIKASPRDFEQIQRDFTSKRVKFYTWSIDPELTTRIIDRCHEENVSVNSCLFAALLSVHQGSQGDAHSPKQSAMAMDLRRYCDPPVGSGLGFYVALEIFKYRVNLRVPFARRVADLHKYLSKKLTPNHMFQRVKLNQMLGANYLDNRNLLIYGLQMENPPQIFHKMMAEMKKSTILSMFLKKNVKETKKSLYGASITNLGNIPLNARYGNLILQKVIFCPPPTPQVETTIGVSSFSGTIQHSIVSNETDENKIQDFIERYLAQLRQF